MRLIYYFATSFAGIVTDFALELLSAIDRCGFYISRGNAGKYKKSLIAGMKVVWIATGPSLTISR
jgi:hypothetical protein